MKKLNLTLLASIFAAGLAQAAGPCENFKISLKNDTANDLIVRQVSIDGGKFQPNSFQYLKANTETIITLNDAVAGGLLKGEMVFDTVSLPMKDLKIRFLLDNKGSTCTHTDISEKGDLSVEKSGKDDSGQINYTIKAK